MTSACANFQAINILPNEILQYIFSRLKPLDLARASRVSNLWNALVNHDFVRKAVRPQGFGAKEWATHFGNVGTEPAIRKIHRILESHCPFWPDRKIKETHSLLLIPQSVNGIPMTLKLLLNLVTNPLRGNQSKVSEGSTPLSEVLSEIGDVPVTKSYWILITNELIPTTRNKKYEAQEAQIQTNLGYDIPKVIELSAFIFTKFVSEEQCLYSDKPHRNYSRCHEQIINVAREHILVGCFSKESGLSFSKYGTCSGRHIGMAGVRKLLPPEE